MKRLLMMLLLLSTTLSFAKDISDLSGCVLSISQEQNVRSHPNYGLFGTAGDVVFKATPEESYYVVSAGKSIYSLGKSVEYLKVVSTDDINIGGYLTYSTGAYSNGVVDFNIYKCGATYGLTEKL